MSGFHWKLINITKYPDTYMKDEILDENRQSFDSSIRRGLQHHRYCRQGWCCSSPLAHFQDIGGAGGSILVCEK